MTTSANSEANKISLSQDSLQYYIPQSKLKKILEERNMLALLAQLEVAIIFLLFFFNPVRNFVFLFKMRLFLENRTFAISYLLGNNESHSYNIYSTDY